MSKEIRIPDYCTLVEPIPLPSKGLINFDEYSRVAAAQITYLNRHEHRAIESFVFGEEVESTTSAFYVQQVGDITLSAIDRLRQRTVNKVGKGVLGLGIWINTDFFGAAHADLIPYAEGHELFEAWQVTVPDITVETAHLAARNYQFSLAEADGNAEKLLDFYVSIIPSLEAELSAAYALATSRQVI